MDKLTEELFDHKTNCVTLLNTKQLKTNDINYISGDSVLHRIKNETNYIAISIHVYFIHGFKLITYD